MILPKSDPVAVERYIETKRTVLRNVDRARNELAELQRYMPTLLSAEAWDRFRRIESILDDIHGEQ